MNNYRSSWPSGLRRAALSLCLVGLGAAGPMTPGVHTSVTLDKVSPLSSTTEIVRRTASPLAAQSVAATAPLASQPLDVSNETFMVYVPARKPPQGYALLVFVPPWDKARLPAGWASVFDDKGVVFVSADHSGNDTKVESRRMPLAVTAAEELMHDYGIDPSRVLVGGFSGGSRVALRLALAYPDVFRGALLNSDADRIGTAAMPLPPTDLFHRFQEDSRVSYIAGELDLAALGMQASSQASLRSWCVLDVRAATMPHAGHATADERTLSLALDALLDPSPPKHEGLAECRARVQSELTSAGQHIETLIASGDKAGARQALVDLDSRFSGLAAEQIVELEKELQ